MGKFSNPREACEALKQLLMLISLREKEKSAHRRQYVSHQEARRRSRGERQSMP